MTCHQPSEPIRDCLTRTHNSGTRNIFVATTMPRTPLTTQTTVKPLSRKLRGAKRVTTTTAKTRKKGYHPNKEEVHTLIQFARNSMKNNANKELKNFENLPVSNKGSK